MHGKAFPVTHHGHGVLRGLPSPFQATRYHSLIVDEATLPRDLLVTARTDGITMAVSHRTRPIEGVQFHPESILTAHGSTIIASFVSAAAHAQTGRATRAKQFPVRNEYQLPPAGYAARNSRRREWGVFNGSVRRGREAGRPGR